MKEVSFIPAYLMKDGYLEELLRISEDKRLMEEAIERGTFFSEEDRPILERSILRKELRAWQHYFCQDCVHRSESLEWHEEHEAEVEQYYDIERLGYVFSCSCFKKVKL